MESKNNKLLIESILHIILFWIYLYLICAVGQNTINIAHFSKDGRSILAFLMTIVAICYVIDYHVKKEKNENFVSTFFDFLLNFN